MYSRTQEKPSNSASEKSGRDSSGASHSNRRGCLSFSPDLPPHRMLIFHPLLFWVSPVHLIAPPLCLYLLRTFTHRASWEETPLYLLCGDGGPHLSQLMSHRSLLSQGRVSQWAALRLHLSGPVHPFMPMYWLLVAEMPALHPIHCSWR